MANVKKPAEEATAYTVGAAIGTLLTIYWLKPPDPTEAAVVQGALSLLAAWVLRAIRPFYQAFVHKYGAHVAPLVLLFPLLMGCWSRAWPPEIAFGQSGRTTITGAITCTTEPDLTTVCACQEGAKCETERVYGGAASEPGAGILDGLWDAIIALFGHGPKAAPGRP